MGQLPGRCPSKVSKPKAPAFMPDGSRLTADYFLERANHFRRIGDAMDERIRRARAAGHDTISIAADELEALAADFEQHVADTKEFYGLTDEECLECWRAAQESGIE